MKLMKIADLKESYKSILIYSDPGIGKTSIVKTLKGKTLLIDVDKGSNVLHDSKKEDLDILRLSEELSDFPKILEKLEKECDYENIIIDTVSELEKAMLTILGKKGKSDGMPELQHYGRVGFKIIDYVRKFRNLNSNLIIFAWEQLREYVSPDGSKFNKSYPMLTGKTSETIMGLMDMVGRLEISTKENEKGQRYINFESSNTIMAKDRLTKRKICKVEDLI
jgi:phage nucleotide-binding protein